MSETSGPSSRPIMPERFNSTSAPVSPHLDLPTPSRTRGDVLVDAVVAVLDRGDHVADWPDDERELHRREGWRSFNERHHAVQELRARKLIAMVKGAAWTSLPPAAVVDTEEDHVCRCEVTEHADGCPSWG